MKFIVPKRKNQYGYVGFDIEKNNNQFIFPCQFVGNIDNFDDREKRKIARQILKLIKKAKNDLYESGNDNEIFQFNSMIWLIQNFIEKGYYYEQEIITKPNISGKVNWKKTIKSNSILFDNGNIIYDKIFSNVKQIDDDAIISEIYKYCLEVSVRNLGFVFGIEKTDRSIYGIKDIKFMTYYLKGRCHNTFLDYKRLLYGHMLNILLKGSMTKEHGSIFVNDKEFEYVFEMLVDKSFGLKDKRKFNPTAGYFFEDEKKEIAVRALRPDTILEYKNDNKQCCCVIDAKYYSFNYGDMSNRGLPEQSSINKQFIYQKFIKENVAFDKDQKYDEVSAVFFLPFCAEENESEIQYMNGYAEAKWNKIKGKVYLFKVDLKALVEEFYGCDKKLKQKFIDQLKNILNKEKTRFGEGYDSDQNL